MWELELRGRLGMGKTNLGLGLPPRQRVRSPGPMEQKGLESVYPVGIPRPFLLFAPLLCLYEV